MKLPPAGVTSAVCTKKSAGFEELRSVAKTCTGPVDRPPVTVNVAVCASVAWVVSTIAL